MVLLRCPTCDAKWVAHQTFVGRPVYDDIGKGCECRQGVIEMSDDFPGVLMVMDEREGRR